MLKSGCRLGIDPLLLYGTNCVKCSDGIPAGADACPAWLLREIAIVAAEDRRGMGDEVVASLNELRRAAVAPLDPRSSVVQRLTPTIEALVVPPSTGSLDDAAHAAFWDARRGTRRVVRRPAAVLTRSRAVAALLAYVEHLLDGLPRASEPSRWPDRDRRAAAARPIVLAAGRLHA